MDFAKPPQSSRRRLGGVVLILLSAAVVGVGCGPSDADGRQVGEITAQQPTLPGIQVLFEDSLGVIRDKRVGLITNHTGIAASPDGELVSSIDLLFEHPEVELVALFSPEHGIRGEEDRENIEDDFDARTGLVIHSLYNDTRKPTAEMLAGVEILLFDIQDIGTRYYSYIWTMALAMEAAGEIGIPFVVLDRPNPIGGIRVQGNVLDPELATFAGLFPVPMRHGLTPGEMARLLQKEFGVQVDLTVVPLRNWARDQSFDETGLPWVPPSPNMPDLVSALHYPGTCLFEGTNLSVGRGTPRPFQQIGAPFIDGPALARTLNALGLVGVRFEAVRFTPEDPTDGKWDGVEVQGVRFIASGSDYDPTRTAIAVLSEARKMAGSEWKWREAAFDRLAGARPLRPGIDAGLGVADLTKNWDKQLQAFAHLRRPALLYSEGGS